MAEDLSGSSATWKLTRNADGNPQVEECGEQGPRYGTNLMGSQEIRERLRVSETQFEQLRLHDNFPAPLADLNAGPVWLTDDIEHWIPANHPNLAPTSR